MNHKPYCETEQDTNCIVRDGGHVKVSMVAMDSACTCSDKTTAIDADRLTRDARQIQAARDHAAGVQLWVDYFNGLHEGLAAERQRTEPERAAYEARIANAWKLHQHCGA
ncbi:hypothetical protein [Algiphilus sp.]|uniref:hypothetical protein n=1 Tax=Algiphilus sp. TaxID=1872431 RepID=UPI0032ED6559